MPLLETKGAGSAQGFGLSLGGEEAVYIEDVFSTYLIKPTADFTTYSINNGIDLSTEGGMTWFKARDAAQNNLVYDTVRGSSSGNANALITNGTQAQQTTFFDFVTPNVNGFTVNFASGGGQLTNSGINYASWTFRKAPKFFDVVTYTGNGSNRTIAHDLGSVPGCIIVKRTDTTGDWQVYHRANTANPETDYLVLNSTAATADSDTRWNDTLPTSTVFSLGTEATVNASGGTYVAYLFAHDAGGFGLEGTDNVISCGSFTTDSGGVASVTLGYEPQLVLVKNSSTTGSWNLYDIMRGAKTSSSTGAIYPNFASAEGSTGEYNLGINATGFTINPGTGAAYTSIYIAIRRGPMEVPTSGTEVFVPVQNTAGTPEYISTFPVDAAISSNVVSVANKRFQSRLTGTGYLFTNSTNAEASSAGNVWDYQNGWGLNLSNDPNFYSWNFRRAPGFFDVVCYTGTGTARTVAHNLAAVPELMIVRRRDNIGNWIVYHSLLGNTYYQNLNYDFSTSGPDTDVWSSTTPSASSFSVGNFNFTNASGSTFVAYLFATLAGVSKVGSYTGNGSSQTINCGFTGGARFVMIKRTDDTGDWYVWDSARGIVAGNDPHLSLNSIAAEVTTDDSVDTDSTGFVVNQVAATNVNVTSASYIFLAIA